MGEESKPTGASRKLTEVPSGNDVAPANAQAAGSRENASDVPPIPAPPRVPMFEWSQPLVNTQPHSRAVEIAEDPISVDSTLTVDSTLRSQSFFPVAISTRSRTVRRRGVVESAVALVVGVAVGTATGWGARSASITHPQPSVAAPRSAAVTLPCAPIALEAPAVVAPSPQAPEALPASVASSLASVPPVPSPEPLQSIRAIEPDRSQRGARLVSRVSASESAAEALGGGPLAMSSSTAPVPVTAATPPVVASISRAQSCRAGCNANLDCLLTCFEPMDTSPSAAPVTALAPIETRTLPSDSDVSRALAATADEVRACGGGSARIELALTFAASGRVTTVNVGHPYRGTPVGSCIARALRNSRVAPFSQSFYQLSMPYRLP